MYTVVSLGTLIGNPIAGAILKKQSPVEANGEVDMDNAIYSGVFIFAGISMLIAATCMHYTRVNRKGFLYFGKI
jgi:hypothetical protein